MAETWKDTYTAENIEKIAQKHGMDMAKHGLVINYSAFHPSCPPVHLQHLPSPAFPFFQHNWAGEKQKVCPSSKRM
jgi:hypothetical protein